MTLPSPRRDARNCYLGMDAEGVSGSIMDFVRRRAGNRVLDLGCGTGGYTAALARAGFSVTGAEVNADYVSHGLARGLKLVHLDGGALPFPDGAFDTVVMVEVIEHLEDGVLEQVLREAGRVARKNVLLTTPDCAQTDQLALASLTHEHYLAADHVRFFDQPTLSGLLSGYFERVEVTRGDPVFPHRLLPAPVRRPLSLLYRAGLLRPTLFSRLFAETSVARR